VLTLLAQSQTQAGTRYISQLTRFYASITPEDLHLRIVAALQDLGAIKVQSRPAEPPAQVVLRVGGYDARREEFQGWIKIEQMVIREKYISLCIFEKSKGNPISWRQLWKAVATAPQVTDFVLKKSRR